MNRLSNIFHKDFFTRFWEMFCSPMVNTTSNSIFYESKDNFLSLANDGWKSQVFDRTNAFNEECWSCRKFQISHNWLVDLKHDHICVKKCLLRRRISLSSTLQNKKQSSTNKRWERVGAPLHTLTPWISPLISLFFSEVDSPSIHKKKKVGW